MAQTGRLVALDELGDSGVAKVEHPDHGVLAVGVSDGAPFAVSGRCRHLLAPLGEGVVRDGCLVCPWHGARYDLASGRMVQRPGGAFKPVGGLFRATVGQLAPLKRFPVEIRDGEIWLT
jgi:nitrite reductase/ring-hydroxylating ferredoxin subunit